MSHRKTILLVDDNDIMRALLRSMLRGEEYEVVGEARDGATAIEMAERLHPHIVCLDVVMPKMDGITALRGIKASSPEIDVVMITGSASAENVQEAIASGASGFIVKPFNAARVLDTLARVVALRAARRSG